jgi:hypothetical protein
MSYVALKLFLPRRWRVAHNLETSMELVGYT